MTYPVYLFDFDYTLANSEKGILICFHRTMEKHGYAPVSDDIIRLAETEGLQAHANAIRLRRN